MVQSVTEDQRAFWSAVVQIIPVLLLALVVEARILAFSREDAAKFWANEAARMVKLVQTKKLRGIWRSAIAALWSNLLFVRRHLTGPVVMIACVALMATAEFVGLLALARGSDLGNLWTAVAATAVLLGMAQVAIAPVLQRTMLALARAMPRVTDVEAALDGLERRRPGESETPQCK
ncbi:hypothetical protein [Microbacterium lacus]|uniref:ABC transmembrane type-1 domain-containing protein n=1 Tax=Microbacterium lacus TaxID=415217 RepID=A0ABP4SYU0_9MICO